MKHGQGVWWYKEDGLVVFHDGADEPAFRQEGPNLFHLRSSTLQDVQKQCIADWKLTEETGVELLVSDKQTPKDGNSQQLEITAVLQQQQHQPCSALVTTTTGGEASAERSPSNIHKALTLFHQPNKGVGTTIVEIN